MNDSQKFIAQIKHLISEKEPLAKIFLYGSRARGTAKPDSDWDFLILLNKETITTEVEKNISYSLYDLEFETGEIISPMIFTQTEWETKYNITPFYKNVQSEGILL
jgi:predicted nucleotidyltransferase